jgi:DNA primase catalytic subunit
MGPERRAEKDELSGVGKQEMLEQQAAREAKEEAAFQELMREVFGGMAGTEEGVMKDTTELLTRHKNNHDDKQAAMYKQWERHVFHNIQNQIAKKLKKLTPDQISKKLRMSPK